MCIRDRTYEDVDLTDVGDAFSMAIQDDGDYDEPEDEDVPDMEDGLKVYLYNESGVDRRLGLMLTDFP